MSKIVFLNAKYVIILTSPVLSTIYHALLDDPRVIQVGKIRSIVDSLDLYSEFCIDFEFMLMSAVPLDGKGILVFIKNNKNLIEFALKGKIINYFSK